MLCKVGEIFSKILELLAFDNHASVLSIEAKLTQSAPSSSWNKPQ